MTVRATAFLEVSAEFGRALVTELAVVAVLALTRHSEEVAATAPLLFHRSRAGTFAVLRRRPRRKQLLVQLREHVVLAGRVFPTALAASLPGLDKGRPVELRVFVRIVLHTRVCMFSVTLWTLR